MSIQSFAQSAATVALFALITSAAQAQPVTRDGILTDAAGRTLYTFDKDQPGKSNCLGDCMKNWPAYVAEPTAGAKPQSPIGRFEHDGVEQWTWNGSPLYYFSGDTKPGDRNGDGKGGMWHVVKIGSSAPATSGSSSAPATMGSPY
ncbi:MAG: hypothetical protein KGN37_15610 [Burkholderiales bacterium]|nr:hypothetical protein [Burkholderiales bacterium]